MDEKKNNESEQHYSLAVPTENKKFWARVGDWFVDLFKGAWYGLTDLFLMSWGNIVLLVFLLFVPLAYAIVCALGYWNPVPNLGKVEMPIFDADRTFIKVEDKNANGYEIGALDKVEINGQQIQVTDDIAEQYAEGKYKFDGVTKYILNNGFEVTPSDKVTITTMNTWDTLKTSGLLEKDKPNKADKDSKFEMTVYPNDELHFRNIRYVNDKNDDNKKWRSGKYQAQVKIDHGYGKALLGLEGIAYAKDGSILTKPEAQALIKANQDGTLPTIDIFQTFQKNFVSSYILSQTSQFASVVADKMSPVTNAIEGNASANATFGTSGKDINNYLSVLPDVVKAKLPSFNDNDYYLVLTKDDFDKGMGLNNLPDVVKAKLNADFDSKTLLGNVGTMSRWLDDVHYFANNNGYLAVNQDKGADLKLIDTLVDSNKPQFENAIRYGLTNDSNAKNDFVTVTNKLLTQLGLSPVELKTTPVFGTGNQVLPFVPSKVKGQDINVFTLSSKFVMDNKEVFGPMLKPFTDLGMPITINMIGTYWSARNAAMASNGADPSKLTKVETARGASMGIFGIGLGQMFILLGIFIGFSMMREALKRNKQYAKLTPRNWYLSKMVDYAVIGVIQTTITMWIIYAAGWKDYISATTMTYEWLWMLMGTFVMMAVICGLQFAMDASLGSVLGIFYLAFNITCSGASYPGWMQSGFYRDISWLMPFTYLLEGSNQIIYGVNNGGGGHFTTLQILDMWGYATIFFAFFFLIGLWGCGKQYKVSCYGSSNGVAVYAGLAKLRDTEAMAKFRHPYVDKKGRVKFKYNWDAIVGPFNPELYKATKHAIKKKISFKWYNDLREKRKIEENEIYRDR